MNVDNLIVRTMVLGPKKLNAETP